MREAPALCTGRWTRLSVAPCLRRGPQIAPAQAPATILDEEPEAAAPLADADDGMVRAGSRCRPPLSLLPARRLLRPAAPAQAALNSPCAPPATRRGCLFCSQDVILAAQPKKANFDLQRDIAQARPAALASRRVSCVSRHGG